MAKKKEENQSKMLLLLKPDLSWPTVDLEVADARPLRHAVHLALVGAPVLVSNVMQCQVEGGVAV